MRSSSETLTPVGRFKLFSTDASRSTLAVLLALFHAVLAVTATVEKSMTSDEIAHLAAGEIYNTRSDFRLQPENGNIPQRLAALPMATADIPHPSTESKAWKSSDIWNYGHALFYEQPVLADQWIFLGRAMIALLSAGTGLLVFFWSRSLFGWRGGFLSLTLFVFCPTFLAHGALATSDMAMTFFFLASVGAWWRHLEKPGVWWMAISSVTLGLAMLAKFSSPLLAPMLGLIGLVWALDSARTHGWRRPLQRLASSLMVHCSVAWMIVWLGYGFRYSAFAPELATGADFNNGWGWALSGIGTPAKAIWWLKEWHLLPEAWLYGLAFVLNFARARGAFMSGEYSTTGWVMFFPFAFLIKTTIPLLLILIAGLLRSAIGVTRRVSGEGITATLGRLRPLTPLATLFAIYWLTSLSSNLNIGHRHILPTYPVLFIAAGYVGQWLDFRRPLLAAGIAAAVMWHAGESMFVRPHYLAYFNQIIGGPQNGWRHLVDSSLDWGQDLPSLKRWLDTNAKGERVFLAYFGTGDPAYEGIRATALPTLPIVGPPRRWYALEPGYYAISATMLQHVYSGIRGPWTIELEREYQQLLMLEPSLLSYQNDPIQRARLQTEAPAENWEIAWKRYDLLRFARLCHYLRARRHDAMIGYSILVYRLSREELVATTRESLPHWNAAIESVRHLR